jgi:hypothetical protein
MFPLFPFGHPKNDNIALPKFDQCLAVIENDDEISPHFSVMVGTEQISKLCYGSEYIMLPLPPALPYWFPVDLRTTCGLYST